jgi:hypothetical protein
MNDLPCENCITLAICRAYVKNFKRDNGRLAATVNLANTKCQLLKGYFYEQCEDGFGPYRSYNIQKIKWAASYLEGD